MLLGLSLSASAQGNSQYPNDNALVGRAIGAFRSQCPQNYTGQISGGVETLGICFVDGFIKRVNLFPVVHCPNSGPCPYLVILLGSVDFDCEGNVIGVNCN